MAASDYPNGRIPLSELTPIGFNVYGDQQYLEPTAARYWVALVIKAGQAGISLSALEGYRSYEEQVRLRNEYLYNGGNAAGIPGTSKHGEAKAVDVYNAGPFGGVKWSWLSAVGPSYGFTNTQGYADGEPWHWVFGAPTIPTGSLGVPIPAAVPPTSSSTTNEENEMAKRVVRCTDIANVGNVTGETQAFITFGEPIGSSDVAVRVFHSEGVRNFMMAARSIAVSPESANLFAPTLSYDQLAAVLLQEVGFDVRKVGPGGGSTANQGGGLMVDGFTWK